MKKLFNEYFEDLNKIWALAKPYCIDVDNEIQWLQLISQNANETRALRIRNESILKDEIFSYEAHIEDIKEDFEADLYEFATNLSHFSRQADIGVAYHIHLLLLRYAEYHHDTDRVIRQCYHIGISLYYITVTANLYGMALYTDQIESYFKRACAYLPDLNTFSSKETRGYILRSLANLKLTWPGISAPGTKGHLFPFVQVDSAARQQFNDHLLQIFTDPLLQEQNPDLPWEDYLYALHFGRTSLLTFLREKEDPALAEEVLISASYVYERQKSSLRTSDQLFSARTVYVYYAAQYHASRITLTQLLDTLFTEYERADLNDQSTDGVYRSLNLLNFIREYLTRGTTEEKETFRARMARADEYSWNYIRRLPLGDHLAVVTNFIRDIMSLTTSFPDIDQYRTYLLNYILACHQPTYVHSLMVAYLTREFCDRMIATDPSYFIGIPGIRTLSDVEINHTSILKLAYDCALYHDIGKGAILNFVSIYGRNLFEEEFKMLQTHPYLGYRTLSDLSGTEYLGDAALGHHKWYDNSAGYPSYYDTRTSSIKPIIDVISVADSIDAATDDVGRSYATAKTLSDLVTELNSFRGTRYAPKVVDLFQDPDYLHKIEHTMRQERFHSYLTVYKNAQINAEK